MTNTGDYFVMLNTQDGNYVPLMFDMDTIARFKTFNDAKVSAENNPLGEHYGYEVFCIGCGELN